VIELIRAAFDLQAVCEAEGWRFCFIGGLAVQRWDEELRPLAELKEAPEILSELEKRRRDLER
jgi:hypothetical protein